MLWPTFGLAEPAAAATAQPPTHDTLISRSLAELRALPDPPDATFTFVVMGDNRGGNDTFRDILRSAKAVRPVFMVNTGDLVERGKDSQFHTFLKLVESTGVPYFTVLGNHDIARHGRDEYHALIGPDYYSFDFGMVRFIYLDNADGHLGAEQLKWFEGQLQGAKESIVFLHKPPPFGKWGHPHRAEGWHQDADEFVALVQKYKVPYVFAGHIHRFDRKVVNGTTYIITGGAGAPLDISKHAAYHFVKVTVGPTGISEKEIKLRAYY